MQLTGTNRSIGLIALIFSVHRVVTTQTRVRGAYLQRGVADTKIACFVVLSFAGLVALAKSLNPIPSRTRPLNSSAPMVLWLKPWESRSLPGLPRTRHSPLSMFESKTPLRETEAAFLFVPVPGARREPLLRRAPGRARNRRKSRQRGRPTSRFAAPSPADDRWARVRCRGEARRADEAGS